MSITTKTIKEIIDTIDTTKKEQQDYNIYRTLLEIIGYPRNEQTIRTIK